MDKRLSLFLVGQPGDTRVENIERSARAMRYIDPQTKLTMHVDRVAAIKAGKKPPPVNVEIDLSNRCNLGCAGCHFAYTHTRGPWANTPKGKGVVDCGDIMDTDLIIRALHEMASYGVKSVTWSGGGEPTLHPEFDKIIQACPLPQGIYTNGTLIDEKRAALLKKLFIWVYVSLDRHDRESYKAYKKTDGFDKAIAGINNLVAAEGNATIGAGFLLSPDNLYYLDDMLALRKRLKVDYIQFRPEIHYDADNPQSRIENTGWISQAVAMLRQVEHLQGVIVDVERFQMYQNWLIHPYKTCYWTQLQTVITPDGRVWQCCNRRGYEESELGNLHNNPFSVIWKRSSAHEVNARCRVMCRGHIANLELNRMISDPSGHDLFV